MTQDELDAAFAEGRTVCYADDCLRIQRVIADRMGLFITLPNAEKIWQEHSDNLCAGWMIIDTDDEIIDALVAYVKAHS